MVHRVDPQHAHLRPVRGAGPGRTRPWSSCPRRWTRAGRRSRPLDLEGDVVDGHDVVAVDLAQVFHGDDRRHALRVRPGGCGRPIVDPDRLSVPSARTRSTTSWSFSSKVSRRSDAAGTPGAGEGAGSSPVGSEQARKPSSSVATTAWLCPLARLAKVTATPLSPLATVSVKSGSGAPPSTRCQTPRYGSTSLEEAPPQAAAAAVTATSASSSRKPARVRRAPAA